MIPPPQWVNVGNVDILIRREDGKLLAATTWPRDRECTVTKSIDPDHARPEGIGDGIVAAVGKLTEALERVQRARGHLYEFHQLIGGADEKVGQAADWLEEQGEVEWAERLRTEMVGRNVLQGRWTFQVVEEFDDGYYADIVETERAARDQFMEGRRHVYESEMKERLRTPGREGHEPVPSRLT